MMITSDLFHFFREEPSSACMAGPGSLMPGEQMSPFSGKEGETEAGKKVK
jgi:hypothetical protein